MKQLKYRCRRCSHVVYRDCEEGKQRYPTIRCPMCSTGRMTVVKVIVIKGDGSVNLN